MLLSSGKNVSVEGLLDTIRTLCLQKRLRINEFFIDFDKLRSGFVSIPQFRRCLSSFGMELKDADFDKLVSRFIDSSVNKVNYIQFATEIDKGMLIQ